MNFKKVGEHSILRSKVKTNDSAALELIEVKNFTHIILPFDVNGSFTALSDFISQKLLTFSSTKRITACGALKLPFFTVSSNAASPDFLNLTSVEAQSSSSSAKEAAVTHSVQSRSSLRIASKNAMSRPFIPSRHSLMPALSRPSSGSRGGRSQNGVSPIGPMTRQRAAALAGDARPTSFASARNGGRRYTQPTRSRASLVSAPAIPEVPIESTMSTNTAIPVAGTLMDASNQSFRGRQKRTARRRTVMGVEKVHLPFFFFSTIRLMCVVNTFCIGTLFCIIGVYLVELVCRIGVGILYVKSISDVQSRILMEEHNTRLSYF